MALALLASGVFLLTGRFPPAVYAFIMIIWGVGWTINHAGLSTLLTDLPRKFLHEAASLNSGVRFIAGGIGVASAGLLMQRNFNFGFLCLGGALAVLLAVSNSLLARRQRI